MKIRNLLVASVLVFPALALGAVGERDKSQSLGERAQNNAERITDADAFVLEIDEALELAREGEYGRLKRGTMTRLENARDTIAGLLEGHASAMELPPQERIDLYNAQEQITAALNNDNKGRMVCKREATTGSRLAKTECMTVAEREARARVARESTEKLFRNVCIPGEGQPCNQ
jgi:hypothetical protein